jgi:hypothetical protein
MEYWSNGFWNIPSFQVALNVDGHKKPLFPYLEDDAHYGRGIKRRIQSTYDCSV